jgi:hypothetical protein
MTTADHRTRTLPDAHDVAAAARSILACPASVNLVVDGVPELLDGRDDVGMQDTHGTPTFLCPVGSPLAEAAGAHRSALITVESGLGLPGAAERRDTLTLAGRLEVRDRQQCDCCAEVRDLVALDLNFVLLARYPATPRPGGRPETQHRVPLDQFRSPAHDLNRGYLQRSVEHATNCHQDELRRAVSTTADTPMVEVVGVTLTNLTAGGVEIRWVDLTGAHRSVVTFPRPAGTMAELGDLLREKLHAGLC